eukprot:4158481-Pyramimonas_sp.AAC.1
MANVIYNPVVNSHRVPPCRLLEVARGVIRAKASSAPCIFDRARSSAPVADGMAAGARGPRWAFRRPSGLGPAGMGLVGGGGS